jgi:hypothetical protein
VTAGQTTQGNSAIAIGLGAGNSAQVDNAIAIGGSAGSITQGGSAIAIGTLAGQTSQIDNAIAIGQEAGNNTQGGGAISIGTFAGQTSQAKNAIAIGTNAGNNAQGDFSICIGYEAGTISMPANAIFLNAAGTAFTPGASGLYAQPVRSGLPPSNPLHYDSVTKEIFESSSSLKYKTDVADLDLTTASNNLYSLNPRSYKYLSNIELDCIGYIAEEVQAIDSRLSVNDRTGAAMNVDWNNIVLYLVAALKKQKTHIDDLTTQINDLTKRIETMER